MNEYIYALSFKFEEESLKCVDNQDFKTLFEEVFADLFGEWKAGYNSIDNKLDEILKETTEDLLKSSISHEICWAINKPLIIMYIYDDDFCLEDVKVRQKVVNILQNDIKDTLMKCLLEDGMKIVFKEKDHIIAVIDKQTIFSSMF